MRKLINCLVIIVIMLVCSLNCVNKIFASEVPEFRIAYELLDYWYGIYGEEMYPDYICGFWKFTVIVLLIVGAYILLCGRRCC